MKVKLDIKVPERRPSCPLIICRLRRSPLLNFLLTPPSFVYFVVCWKWCLRRRSASSSSPVRDVRHQRCIFSTVSHVVFCSSPSQNGVWRWIRMRRSCESQSFIPEKKTSCSCTRAALTSIKMVAASPNHPKNERCHLVLVPPSITKLHFLVSASQRMER